MLERTRPKIRDSSLKISFYWCGERRTERRDMAWSATMIGALLGLGTQMYSNALRKLPYMRRESLSPPPLFPLFLFLHSHLLGWLCFFLLCLDPWEHVVGMGLGVVFVNQLVKWDAQLQEDLDKMLAKAKAANEHRYFGISLFFSSSFFYSVFAFICHNGCRMNNCVSISCGHMKFQSAYVFESWNWVSSICSHCLVESPWSSWNPWFS